MTSEVGFWYKGSVREVSVLPVYELMTFSVQLVGYEVKVYNDNKDCIVINAQTIEEALFDIHRMLEKREDFFD